MQLRTKVSLVATSMTLALITGFPAAALGARNTQAEAQTSSQTATSEDSRKSETVDGKNSEKSAENKLKVCQKREKVVTSKLSRIAKRGQKQLDLFTTIAGRTETFYTEKGKTLSNYDVLVKDVNDKKATAQVAVDAVKATTVTFKCDGTDPKGAASSFKEALKNEITALKAYKTSVKNLIVGVKSVNGKTTSEENKTTEKKTTETKPTEQTTTGGTQ